MKFTIITLIIGIVVLIYTIRATTSNRISSTSLYTPLPNTKGVGETEKDLIRKEVRRLPGYCRSLQKLLVQMPENLEMIGQCETALQYSRDEVMFGNQPPIAIYAKYGIDGSGDSYLSIDTFNTNRETNKVRLIFRGPDGNFISVIKHVAIESKLPGLIIPIYMTTEFIDWKDFIMLASHEDSLERIEINDPNTVIPFAVDKNVVVTAAVEDRNGKVSNYVKVYRVDMNRLGVKGDEEDD